MPALQASLQESTLFVARGFMHRAFAPQPLLSIKCMFNGRARYAISRASFAVNESGYLVLNDGQPYEIEIDSPTRVESFIVFFPRDWANEVLRSLTTPADRLLDDPQTDLTQTVRFFERFTPHDRLVSPAVAALRQAHKTGPLPDVLVEQRLRGLLARMLIAQRATLREIDGFPGRRAATRHELWRRLNRARDFIRAQSHLPLTLSEIAVVAALSPFHFLRAFKTAFHETPHGFLSECRSEQARFLLARTELSVTEICFAVGFESLGTFSSWFRRRNDASPRQWQNQTRIKKHF
jgi:AraC-like DNA-binding protein